MCVRESVSVSFSLLSWYQVCVQVLREALTNQLKIKDGLVQSAVMVRSVWV